MQKNLPEKFVRIITKAHGLKGEQWLFALPKIITEIERDWAIKVGSPFLNLSYHFVAPCVCADGSEAVLKIGFPEDDSPIFNEAEMLKLYDGEGAARFLRFDERNLAMLIERLNPGDTLQKAFAGDDAKAVDVYIDVLKKIIRKPPQQHKFVRLEKWFGGFEKAKTTDFPAQSIIKAQRFYEELTASSEKYLIHGDFHHENVLSSNGGFLAIDPKGVVGELGYEISVFLNNHAWWLEKDSRLSEKTDDAVLKLSEAFAIAPQDLRKWAYAQCVLSAWWTFEENRENWKPCLAAAEVWKV